MLHMTPEGVKCVGYNLFLNTNSGINFAVVEFLLSWNLKNYYSILN